MKGIFGRRRDKIKTTEILGRRRDKIKKTEILGRRRVLKDRN